VEARVKWQGNLAFTGLNASGHTILMDAPPSKGGEGTGPSPMETVLMGLGGCTGIDMVHILRKMQVELEDLEVVMWAERAPVPPQVFTRIKMVYRVSGPNLPMDKLQRAAELTQSQYCSVLHMLNKTAQVEWCVEVV